MGLVVRIPQGDAWKAITFDDGKEKVVFGRDGDRCDVVFPVGAAAVGREHFALQRVLGRYRLVLNGDNLVLVNGKTAFENQELPEQCEVQLGPKGPKVVLRRTEREDLPDTVGQGHRAGAATQLQRTVAATGRNRWMLVGVLGLVVVAGVLGTRALTRQEQRIDTTASDLQQRLAREAEARTAVQAALDGMKGELSTVRNDLVAVGGDLGDLSETIGAMTKRFTDVEERLDASRDRLEESLLAVRPSVYLVLVRQANGSENGLGTAWVVQDGVLATNAHVAETLESLPEGVALLVRSNAEAPKTYGVERITLHPGYRAFARLWEGYVPVEGTDPKSASAITFPGGACDVALLHLRAPWDGLAPPLALADDEELRHLEGGDALGTIGYPMEGVAFGGTPLRQPTPQTQIGAVTSVTDYFGAHGESDAAREENLLIQHSCPAAGGASGSPIVDTAGRVVALLSAGNLVGFDSGPRISVGVGVNYAQRADLLDELLRGEADERQVERAAGWERRIQALYNSGHLLERELQVDEVLTKATLEIESTTDLTKTVAWEKRAQGEVQVGVGGGAAPSPVGLAVAHAGGYLVVLDADRRQEIQTNPCFEASDGSGICLVPVRLAPWLQVGNFETDQPGKLDVEVEAVSGPTRVRAQLFEATVRPLASAEIRERVLRRWLTGLVQERGGTWNPATVASGVSRLDRRGVARLRATLPTAGPHLAIGVTPGFEPVDMQAIRTADGAVLGEDHSADHYPAFAFAIEQPQAIDLVVAGPGAGATVEIFVFRADPGE